MAAEEMEGEDKGPEAHQGAGPAAEKEEDQSLILDRIELTTEEHLGRVRTTMKEVRRSDMTMPCCVSMKERTALMIQEKPPSSLNQSQQSQKLLLPPLHPPT